MSFAHPHFLWLLLLLIPLTVWYVLKQRNAHATMSLSTISPFAGLGRSWKEYLRYFLFVLRLAAIACLIVVLARPQTHASWRTSSTEGTDIILALDVSTSMLARDFNPDRFGAAKDVASRFISGRESDNIGIVVFAGESLTGVPMTMDRPILMNYLQNLEMGVLEDGTAIGDGIATSLNRLQEGHAVSKSIILLTDGSNNTGVIAPMSAAEVAKEMGVKIYTVGIGKNGMADYPVRTLSGRIEYQPQPVVIDEATLRSIASATGGEYFRATDNRVLENVFHQIDTLEKTRMDVRHFSHTEETFMLWALLALGFFGIELLLRYTLLRSIP